MEINTRRGAPIPAPISDIYIRGIAAAPYVETVEYETR